LGELKLASDPPTAPDSGEKEAEGENRDSDGPAGRDLRARQQEEFAHHAARLAAAQPSPRERPICLSEGALRYLIDRDPEGRTVLVCGHCLPLISDVPGARVNEHEAWDIANRMTLDREPATSLSSLELAAPTAVATGFVSTREKPLR
jgi:hypothetical protein